MAIDLRPGDNDYTVVTKVKRGNDWYMGPEVIVKARDAEHAKTIARQNGHEPNDYFPPREHKKR